MFYITDFPYRINIMVEGTTKWRNCRLTRKISRLVLFIYLLSTHPSKELCSKMALGKVGLSLP